jgi:2-oxoglutarate dehydrogenase E1 component
VREDNMTVAMPSTPASHFHLLRRQAYAQPRRPLVVFTPKSMLRLKAATSAPEDLTEATFEPVLADPQVADASAVTRVLLCSGKVYYDLVAERRKREDASVAILRVEQLAPLPAQEIVAALGAFSAQAEVVWVQEEPANQGPWPYVALNLPEHLGGRPLMRVTRPASASPAVGSHKAHEREQRALVDTAFAR